MPILQETKDFVKFTFEVIEQGKMHEIASVFTFGREDIIPEMFIEIVRKIEKNTNFSLDKLIYYLQRHIEVDGDDHGPLSLSMICELCGSDEQKWKEATIIALKAIEKRMHLWNGVRENIQKQFVLN
jgi:pyrroloquinoline quinone (PQQ) biosynthesis protein C